MIAIVNYDRKAAKKLSAFLSERNIENIITLDEAEISRAGKIILPHFSNLKATVRKLQLSNVFNLLKVIKKDILAINSGMLLFCHFVNNDEINGLGVLEKVEVCSRTYCSFNSKLKILDSGSKLLTNCDVEQFRFEFEYYLSESDFTVAQVEFEKQDISAVIANKNYYAALFSIEESGSAGEKFIRNFLSI